MPSRKWNHATQEEDALTACTGVNRVIRTLPASWLLVLRIRATIRPYRPNTSAKMRIRIIPMYRRGCWAVPRTPASPTIPMAKPAARPARPTDRPAPSWMKPAYKVMGDLTDGQQQGGVRTVTRNEHTNNETVNLRRQQAPALTRTAIIPAITTGMIHLISRSGRSTPIAEIPTPDLAVP